MPPSNAAMFGVVTALVLAVLAAFVWARQAPWSRARASVLLGVVWCAVAMLPGALTAPTLRIIGDRYAYFPLVGATIALAGLLDGFSRHTFVRFSPIVIVVVAVVQSFRLESRLDELQSQDAMFRATLARDPDNFTTLTLWGNVLARRGEYIEAEDAFVRARRSAPFSGDIDTGLSFVHLRERRYADAEADGRRAIASKPENPRAWLNLASALVDEGQAEPALEAATEALRVKPHYAEARFVRAIALMRLGRNDDARADLEAVLVMDPTHMQARSLLDRLQAKHGAP